MLVLRLLSLDIIAGLPARGEEATLIPVCWERRSETGDRKGVRRRETYTKLRLLTWLLLLRLRPCNEMRDKRKKRGEERRGERV